MPLTLNTVLHRDNLDRVDEVIALAERLGADRLELANTQYLGWALANRAALLPTPRAARRARARWPRDARRRLRGHMEVLFVTPDYYAEFPKACMDGWGRRFIVVTPDGLVLPCHAAHTLPGLAVRHGDATARWKRSGATPRASTRSAARPGCPSRAGAATGARSDFGGCRCQAFHLTGNAAATDPVCRLSPDHGLIETAREAAAEARPVPLVYRGPRAGVT